MSLFSHGPNILLYPGAFEPYPRGILPINKVALFDFNFLSSVELYRPSQFGLPYEDVKLTTSDKVVLHAYLLMQEKTSKDKCSNNGKGVSGGADKEYYREVLFVLTLSEFFLNLLC